MKEKGFIRQNKEKWMGFEEALSKDSKNPEELADIFVEITDDLSYSRTYYPNRSVRVYLNQIALKIFGKVYSRNRITTSFFKDFFFKELPSLMYHCRREMIISLLVFVVAGIIGVVSSINDPDFASSILSERYTEMTDNNMANDDPMAVYRSRTAFQSFWMIFWNNIRIDLITYSFGLMFSIGSLFILLYNGVMVGAFQYYFVGTGFFIASVLTIWLHGTIEISTIVLSGGAGIVTGRGLLFPGTYSRLEALRKSATQGFKLFVGIIPFTLIAAIIEATVTRQTDAPAIMKLSFIILCFLLVVSYFILLPWYLKRKNQIQDLDSHKEYQSNRKPFKLLKIKTVGEVFSDAFFNFRQHMSQWFVLATLGTIVLLAVKWFGPGKQLYILDMDETYQLIVFPAFSVSQILSVDDWRMALTVFAIGAVAVFISIRQFNKTADGGTIRTVKSVIYSVLAGFLLLVFVYPTGYYFLQLLIYLFAFIPFMLVSGCINHPSIESLTFGKISSITFKQLMSKILEQFFFLFLIFAGVVLAGSPISDMMLESLLINFPVSDNTRILVSQFIQMGAAYFTILFGVGIWAHGAFVRFFSDLEKYSGYEMQKEIEHAFH